MMIDMLKAVYIMLEHPESTPETKAASETVFETQVACARVILSKVISSLEVKVATVPTNPPGFMPPVEPVKPTPEKPLPKDKIQIVMNEDKTIGSIRGAKDSTFLMLDGKKMPWREAIGKTFINAEVLDV